MRILTVVGGSRGLGFVISEKLQKFYDCVNIIDIAEPLKRIDNVNYYYFDLSKDNILSIKDLICKSTDLIVTAGIGQIKLFSDCSLVEINKVFTVNALAPIKILKLFYNNLLNSNDSKCMIVSSIAGEVCSPLFATYGASKSSISKICESLNIELEKSGTSNRITCITATSFSGTSFYGGKTNPNQLSSLADECISAMNSRESLHFINSVLCNDIIARYYNDRHSFGASSFDYKLVSGRACDGKKYIIGYLSGTFDLFHIGHLNILKKAKKECDYLIVGVHASGAWKGKETFIPFEERLEIVRSIRYVDEADESFREDSDAWYKYHFDKLFVGSDYKGSERFSKYEDFFKDKKVEIVYFPYTKGTSSTQLREKLSKK